MSVGVRLYHGDSMSNLNTNSLNAGERNSKSIIQYLRGTSVGIIELLNNLTHLQDKWWTQIFGKRLLNFQYIW